MLSGLLVPGISAGKGRIHQYDEWGQECVFCISLLSLESVDSLIFFLNSQVANQIHFQYSNGIVSLKNSPPSEISTKKKRKRGGATASQQTATFEKNKNSFQDSGKRILKPTQKKIEEEIQTQIIKDIEKFDKIEALQSFQNLMYKSAPKKLVQQRITIFFIFNGADPSVHQSQIKKK